ncbi:hypothetical protein ACFVTP_32650 [Streptomyces celluloflavus]|uniref:hypothetical protein n=1 Tax=Streptomyces celluloflavus TaxID=58344 RepID=UPI0036DA7971
MSRLRSASLVSLSVIWVIIGVGGAASFGGPWQLFAPGVIAFPFMMGIVWYRRREGRVASSAKGAASASMAKTDSAGAPFDLDGRCKRASRSYALGCIGFGLMGFYTSALVGGALVQENMALAQYMVVPMAAGVLIALWGFILIISPLKRK